jgi:hypothetical protein
MGKASVGFTCAGIDYPSFDKARDSVLRLRLCWGVEVRLYGCIISFLCFIV